MWIRPLQVVSAADGHSLTLFAPNRFVVDWVKDKYLELIHELMADLDSSRTPQIALEVGSSRQVDIGAANEQGAPVAVGTARPAAPAVAPSKTQVEAQAHQHRSNLISAITSILLLKVSRTGWRLLLRNRRRRIP